MGLGMLLMTMALTSNTWTRPTRSKIYNPNAMVPAIGTNNGSGTGSVVPSLLPAASTNCVCLDPVCEHNTNRLLRGLNSTLPVSDSLGWSCTISSFGGTCAPQHSHLTRSLDLLSSTNAAELFTTNGTSSSEESVKSWWMAASTNAGGPGSEPSLGTLRIRQWGPGFFASPIRTPRKPYLALILRTCRVCPFVTLTG